MTGYGIIEDEPNSEFVSEHYLDAQPSLVEHAIRTLKQGDAFAVLDVNGDIQFKPEGPGGVFFRDTRYLSQAELRINGKHPLLLSSFCRDDNSGLMVDLTNPDIRMDTDTPLPRDLIAIQRTKFLLHGIGYDRVGLRNFDSRPHKVRLSFHFDADFRDLFEVRGAHRPRRGESFIRLLAKDRVEFSYHGLDAVVRRSKLQFNPTPQLLDEHTAFFDLFLPGQGRAAVEMAVCCEEGTENRQPVRFIKGFRDARRLSRAMSLQTARIESSNQLFNEVISRSFSDLNMLISQTPQGPYPYAGVPWYSTTFGRDGILTAMMMLWVEPSLAKGVLLYLAAHQAQDFDPVSDAQPGKILHERRQGEMARTGEVPFQLYYGTIDATPLFIVLAGRYYERTGDLATIQAIWSNIEAALRWCDEYGDRDKDGFVEYLRETENGLANQGWKDSHDSMFHADGHLAEGPIALCEVQSYVYAAKKSAALLANALGHSAAGSRLLQEAEALRIKFEDNFWCEDIGSYALALDAHKKPCAIVASNAGHALFGGIASPDRARRVAAALLNSSSFGGWGVRTVAQGEARYNPMSYHNGSVWPHDNAVIAAGFATYGLKAEALRIFTGMYEAAVTQEFRRLPELFCGFPRRQGRGPIPYPVACSPQAWAASTTISLLASCLGIKFDVARNEICFENPILPAFLDEVVLRNINVGSSQLDLCLRRYGSGVTVNILRRQGDAKVIFTA
jgi:glycogen debranching enzyme